jgi:hypothetical protein
MKAWKYVEQTINKILRDNTSILYDQVVLNTIRSYPVGMSQVDKHLKRFYIETDVVRLEDGRLVSPKKKETSDA